MPRARAKAVRFRRARRARRVSCNDEYNVRVGRAGCSFVDNGIQIQSKVTTKSVRKQAGRLAFG